MSPDSQQSGQTVGARMRAARLAKKYTQQQLAHPDFSVSYISAIERNQIQPSLRALEILAQRLELSATDLLPPRGPLIGEKMVEESKIVEGMERDLLLLEAQIAIRQGQPEQAIEMLRKLLPRKTEPRPESAVYYILGWAYLESGRLQESEQSLAEAARQAREAPDPFYPCILSLQCTVYTAMRNAEQAAQLRHNSLSLLARQEASTGNSFFLARLYASLGQHYNHLGQFDQAQQMLRQALALLQARTSCQQLEEGYLQLMQSYKEQAAYPLASLYGYKCLLANFRARFAGARTDTQYALERSLLKSSPEEAYAYLLAALEKAGARHDSLAQASANVHLAAWFIAHADFSKAEAYAQAAREQAAPYGETLIQADALLLAGDLAYRRQDYAACDRDFELGLAMLEHLGQEEDLVEHLAHYARLLEERNLVHEALRYWKRAYESRQRSRPTSL